jgi:carbon monoxide dehydrogenase subunit G
VTSEEATALFQMRCNWESYRITFTGGVWTAIRYNNPTQVLTADTAAQLNWQIRVDYGQWLQDTAESRCPGGRGR